MNGKINEYEEEVHLEVSLGENVNEEVIQGFFFIDHTVHTQWHTL